MEPMSYTKTVIIMTEINFPEHAPEYRQHIKDSDLAANTKDKRLNMINNFIEYCQQENLKIETENFHKSVDKIEQYFDQTTVHGVKISAIRDFLDYIGDQHDTKTDLEIDKIRDRLNRKRLMDKQKYTGRIDKEDLKQKQLSEEEIQKAKKHMDKKTSLLIDLMYYTAVRPGEALALTPEKLDIETQSFEVNATYSAGKKKFEGDPIQDKPKHDSGRTIPVASSIFARLLEWIEENEIAEDERVWKSYSSDVYRPVKDAFTEAEVRINDKGKTDVTPHWFRHIACTRLINEVEGNEKKDVQKHMGHSSVKITEHYENVDREEVVDTNVE